MPEIDYDVPLDDEELEWMRVRFSRVGRRILRYTVQYETTIDGQRVPVARHDNAHGRPHIDLMSRGGGSEKIWLPDVPSPNAGLTWGQQDITQNWPRYRRRFFEDAS